MLADLKTSEDMMEIVRNNFRKRRKALGYNQIDLALWSGVSLGSLKRFEQSGKISFESLLKLSLILECLEDFEKVCSED